MRPSLRLAAVLPLSCILAYGCGPSDPETAIEEGSEVKSNAPGVREVAPGVYEVVIIAHESAFQPSVIRVPVGATVTFRMRSSDPTFVHSFLVTGTPIEMEMIGLDSFSEITHTFEEAGEYPFACFVYCGAGHESMFGTLIVE